MNVNLKDPRSVKPKNVTAYYTYNLKLGTQILSENNNITSMGF